MAPHAPARGRPGPRAAARTLALGAALAVAGCTPSDLGCSAPNVLDTVKSLARDAFAKDEDYGLFDADKSTYAVDGVRTVGCTDTTCTCRASLTVSLELADVIKNLMAISPFYAADAELKYPQVKQKEATFGIGYTSELTDDGKDVYVTFDGL